MHTRLLYTTLKYNYYEVNNSEIFCLKNYHGHNIPVILTFKKNNLVV